MGMFHQQQMTEYEDHIADANRSLLKGQLSSEAAEGIKKASKEMKEFHTKKQKSWESAAGRKVQPPPSAASFVASPLPSPGPPSLSSPPPVRSQTPEPDLESALATDEKTPYPKRKVKQMIVAATSRNGGKWGALTKYLDIHAETQDEEERERLSADIMQSYKKQSQRVRKEWGKKHFSTNIWGMWPSSNTQ